MVPLTEATIEFSIGGATELLQVGTVVVNHQHIDWVAPALDDEVRMPDLPLLMYGGPLVKDFTGDIRGEGSY